MSIAKCPVWFVCFSNLPFSCQEIKQTDATLFEGLHYIRCLTHHLLDLQQQLTAMHYSQSRADSNWWCRGAGNLSFLTLSLPNTCNTVLLYKGPDLLRKKKKGNEEFLVLQTVMDDSPLWALCFLNKAYSITAELIDACKGNVNEVFPAFLGPGLHDSV